ncbi:MAG: hypothetical protein V4621_05325 [Pseudomonadota bacterium]
MSDLCPTSDQNCIIVEPNAVAAHAGPFVPEFRYLRNAAQRPNVTGIVGQFDLASLAGLPRNGMGNVTHGATLKRVGLPLLLPENYAALLPLIEKVVDIQAADPTMPYDQTKCTLLWQRAFWPASQYTKKKGTEPYEITDYRGFRTDSGLLEASKGIQERVISYMLHDAGTLSLAFHHCAVDRDHLATIGNDRLNSRNIEIAIHKYCTRNPGDAVLQNAGNIVRRDELTAWGAAAPVLGDGRLHDFITLNFSCPQPTDPRI